MTADRADLITPTAAELVCAVADRDRDDILRILSTPGLDWQALAVVLAGNVDPDSELARAARVPLTNEQIANTIITETAKAWGLPIGVILSADRHRHVADARAVAMAACRLAGLSSPYIGSRFNRDHSTVLHAAGKVGESERLRRIAKRIATPVTLTPGLLGDEEGSAA